MVSFKKFCYEIFGTRSSICVKCFRILIIFVIHMKKELKIDIDLMDKFPSQYPNKSYSNYVANKVGLEGFIAVTGMLLPEIIETEGCIFLKENIPMLNGNLKTRFGNDRKTLERYVNLLCLSDFYLLAADEA